MCDWAAAALEADGFGCFGVVGVVGCGAEDRDDDLRTFDPAPEFNDAG